MSLPSDFFIAGGTLRARAPSYVTRLADQELFEHTLAGEFCYVLTTRQMGKSSLMIRTARRLAEAGRTVAILDLTGIGSGSAEQWYLGLLEQTARDLRLNIDVPKWWQARASLAIPQRFSEFLRDVVLQAITGPVVIFIDEIDSTLNFDFRDDFFAAIRAIYNARATESAYQRLTFALLGVATPTDLIKDRKRTPFNIGRRIVLQEFSYDEAKPLRMGLEACHPGQGDRILRRIFDWTNGYPYLTQKLCLEIAEATARKWTDAEIDRLVETLFLSDAAQQEDYIQFVNNYVEASRERRQLMQLYKRVYAGKVVKDDKRSPAQNRLKLTGLVCANGGELHLRNEIYRQVFNTAWIKRNTPTNVIQIVTWIKRNTPTNVIQIVTWGTVVIMLAIGTTLLFPYLQQQRDIAEYKKAYQETIGANARMDFLDQLCVKAQEKAQVIFFANPDNQERRQLFEDVDVARANRHLVAVFDCLFPAIDDHVTDPTYRAQLVGAMCGALHRLDYNYN